MMSRISRHHHYYLSPMADINRQDIIRGMMAEVDVITEQRTLLYWLFEPLLALYKK